MATRYLSDSRRPPSPITRPQSSSPGGAAARAGSARLKPATDSVQPHRVQRFSQRSASYSQRQPGENDSSPPNSSPRIKLEPDSLHKASLSDQRYHGAASMRPAKRPALDDDFRPLKIGPRSASPEYSSGPHENPPSPPLDVKRSKSPGSPGLSLQQFFSSSRQSTQSPFQHEVDRKYFNPAPGSPVEPDHDVVYEDTGMLLQPDTRPISQEQLVNEVKGIYAGLVMVEKKCVEICQEQSQSTVKLSNEQWQALIALHRTLLHEHHDFFLASQHPTASPALRRLPTKYAMPARMWRHGIHSFLELLRHRLPYSLEHMLSFVYLAYQMMALLMESVPAFHETWIECLGDLARYRMAIEEVDMKDRETWSNVARMWYNRAADRSPDTGRIQHHLAVLARPNIVCQLFQYSKALVSVQPFPNARDSIMLLFNPLLEAASLPSQNPKKETVTSKYSKFDYSLVTAAGMLFTKGSIHDYCVHIIQFTSELDNHIARSGSNWKVQGTEVASALISWMLDFGSDENFLWGAFRAHHDKLKGIQPEPANTAPKMDHTVPKMDQLAKEDSHRKFWMDTALSAADFRQAIPAAGVQPGAKFVSADQVTSYAIPVWSNTVSMVASKVGDRNILPFLHVTLAFLWSLSYVPGGLIYLENDIPWAKLVLSLNTLSRSGVVDARVESSGFPQQQSGTGRQLPEDFLIRGLVWAPFYFPPDFFEGQVVDEDERTLELPSHAAPRAERCIWLGARLASLNRYITYDLTTKQFGCTEFALSLPGNASMNTLHVLPPASERDVSMTDV